MEAVFSLGVGIGEGYFFGPDEKKILKVGLSFLSCLK